MHVKDLFDLSGKVALVTGGSRGLGFEIATGLGEAGAKVVITARRDKWLTPAQQQLAAEGITALALTCDVANPDQVNDALGATLRTFGRVDVLINNAGTAWSAPAESMTLDKWREVMETNATGCFLMSQAVGREMIRGGNGGAIVNIASYIAGFGSDPEIIDAVAYSASKGAVVSLTRDLAVKWARHGIRVNAIAPGTVWTPMVEDLGPEARERRRRATPLGTEGTAWDVGWGAVYLASDEARWVTGQTLVVDGGLTITTR